MNRSSNRILCVVLAAASVFTLVSCSAAYVRETQPIERKLASFRSVTIEATSASPDLKKHVDPFVKTLVTHLQEEKVFDQVSTKKGGNLTLKLRINKVSEGNAAARMANLGGEAEVEVAGDLMAGKEKVGSFVATGDSKRNSSLSVGGLNVTKVASVADNLVERAYESTSEHITDFLKEKK